MTKAEFKKLVENGPVILDGATGTNLQKAGMPVGVCPEQWILENPDIMIKLQEDYVAAGTDILYAPTFTANRIKLEEYGLADRLEELKAVGLGAILFVTGMCIYGMVHAVHIYTTRYEVPSKKDAHLKIALVADLHQQVRNTVTVHGTVHKGHAVEYDM